MTKLRDVLLPAAWRPEPRRLLPTDPSVAAGPPLARAITLLYLGLVLVRSLVHLLAADGGAGSIATIDLSVEGGDNIIAMFGQWGAVQLVLGLLLTILVLRYPGLVPLVLATLAIELVLREVAGALKPITTVRTAPGAAGNAPALVLVTATLLLSLCPRRLAEPAPPPVVEQPTRTDAATVDADPVASRIAELEAELLAAVGSDSLCAISRTAGSVPAAKYLEGRLAALMELRRAVRGGRDLSASLAALRETWQRALDDVTARDAGPDWRAYRAGGVDELDELAESA
jgi:hypothetical protein